MDRIEVNVMTGEAVTVPLTPEEQSDALARTAAEATERTPDAMASRAVDSMDRLQFEHLFDLENRLRALEAQPAITRPQYRNALINRWKQVNP